jgi:hypothetical protein
MELRTMGQEWYYKLLKICNKHNFEPLVDDNNKLIVICPVKPSTQTQTEIYGLIPENINIVFQESIKYSAVTAINLILKSSGIRGMEMASDGRKLSIKVLGDVEPEPHIYSTVSDILTKDEFYREWRFFINGDERLVVIPKVTAALQSNKPRDTSISKDDVQNLVIALNSATGFDDFLNQI